MSSWRARFESIFVVLGGVEPLEAEGDTLSSSVITVRKPMHMTVSVSTLATVRM